LLVGDGRVDAYQACANVAERPADSFEIDPRALIAAYRAERAGGRAIVGCYHSHPSGDAMPSVRDAQAAEANGWIWLIVAGGEAKAFRAVEGGALHDMFDPVELRMTRHRLQHRQPFA
jgi:proteasome lid subunit RPN8/RPN11